ncbi:MAG TPA: DUF2283 domain-containing protein [Pseudonocardiaceae bacterium]|nr:DUF2283 domain-containing protein [Pseudonocardiaceae bacterium]
MRIKYDVASRGLLIAFGAANDYSESREVADGVVVDFDRDGRPLAIELEDVAAVSDTKSVLALVAPQVRSGADLLRFREALSMTQQELGDALDIPRNTIARWERDEMTIEKPRLLSLALGGLIAGTDNARKDAVLIGSKRSKASKVKRYAKSSDRRTSKKR